jgi:hypothetical protein
MALIIIMVILGGQRTLQGPVIGAVVVEVVSEALRAYGQIRMVLFALVVIGMMRLCPPGWPGWSGRSGSEQWAPAVAAGARRCAWLDVPAFAYDVYRRIKCPVAHKNNPASTSSGNHIRPTPPFLFRSQFTHDPRRPHAALMKMW